MPGTVLRVQEDVCVLTLLALARCRNVQAHARNVIKGKRGLYSRSDEEGIYQERPKQRSRVLLCT